MKIEAGKSYRTRDGRKATIYRTDARSETPVHGCILHEQKEVMFTWLSDGYSWGSRLQNPCDLIAPWTEEPTMDISALPRWATHVTFTYYGWTWCSGKDNVRCGSIPNEYAPTQTVPVGSRYRIDRDNNRMVLEEGGAK